MTYNDIQPCPICGSQTDNALQPKLNYNRRRGFIQIECGKCGIGSPIVYEQKFQVAIDTWNLLSSAVNLWRGIEHLHSHAPQNSPYYVECQGGWAALTDYTNTHMPDIRASGAGQTMTQALIDLSQQVYP